MRGFFISLLFQLQIKLDLRVQLRVLDNELDAPRFPHRLSGRGCISAYYFSYLYRLVVIFARIVNSMINWEPLAHTKNIIKPSVALTCFNRPFPDTFRLS